MNDQVPSNSKLYARRDIRGQGEHYTRHIWAMTAEVLVSKSDIAAELAHRDIEIEATRDMLTDARLELEALREALGVDFEPHQSLHERMLDAANHKRVERGVQGPCPNCGAKWASVELSPSHEPCPVKVRTFHIDSRGLVMEGKDGPYVGTNDYRALLKRFEKACADLTAARVRILDLEEAASSQPPTPDDARDASRWRALIGCARVRVLGCAGLNDPASEYAHIGVELWTRHPAQSLPESIETLTAFADRAVLTKHPECQHDKSKPGPTLVPLGSAAFGSSDWTWMCTVCNERFNLPTATAQGEGE